MARLLAFVQSPNPHWLLKALMIGIVMAVVPLVWIPLSQALLGPLQASLGPLPSRMELVVAALFVAPIVETLALLLLYWLLVEKAGLPVSLFIVLVCVLAVVVHPPYGLHRSPISVMIFAIMATQMAGWWREAGIRLAFAGVTLSHAVYNAVAGFALPQLFTRVLG